jgi:hypothetical protein
MRYRRFEDDAEIPDGSAVRVRLDMCDSMQRRVVDHFTKRTILDAVQQDMQTFSGHRPMQATDALFSYRTSVGDAARLAGAAARRQAAFDALVERSSNAWRNGPPQLVADPSAPYDQQRPPLDPADINGNDDPDDDPDDDQDENGLMRGPVDHNDPEAMQRAQDARESARLQRDQVGNEKWRNPPSLYTVPRDPAGYVQNPVGGRLAGRSSPYAMGNSAPSGGALSQSRQPVVEREYEAMLNEK